MVKHLEVQLYFRPSSIPSLMVVRCCLPVIRWEETGRVLAGWLVTAAVPQCNARLGRWLCESANLRS